MNKGILQRFATALHGRFQPASPDEYFALRLARGLGEPAAAAHYAVLTSQHTFGRLVHAYHKATSSKSDKPSAVFHDILTSAHVHHGYEMDGPEMMAIRIERRSVAVALFAGIHLLGRRSLQLSSDAGRAENSATSFVREILSEHNCSSVVMEKVVGDVRRSLLYGAILRHCRAGGVSVWEVSKQQVLEALAHPPLKTRRAARDLMLRLWPMPSLKKTELAALDAFALGLYIQTERLLAAAEP